MSENAGKFTICVLLYGEYTALAGRCINSICMAAPQALPDGLRVGLNVVGKDTERYVQALVEAGWLRPQNIYRASENIHKYPMMRRMLYDQAYPITTPYVMWFDDDSYVKDEMEKASPTFLDSVAAVMGNKASPDTHRLPAVIGGIYTLCLRPGQADWIQAQSWYGGVSVKDPMRFITGGWWTARLEELRRLNYPWKSLDHRGGDVMLGAACDQAGMILKNHRKGVAINADEQGRESKATRRGFDSNPIGTGFKRGVAADIAPPVDATPPPPPQQAEPAARKIEIHTLLDL